MEDNKNLEQNLDRSDEKLHLSDVINRRELLIDFLKWIEDVYWDNNGIEDCVDTYLKQKSINSL